MQSYYTISVIKFLNFTVVKRTSMFLRQKEEQLQGSVHLDSSAPERGSGFRELRRRAPQRCRRQTANEEKELERRGKVRGGVRLWLGFDSWQAGRNTIHRWDGHGGEETWEGNKMHFNELERLFLFEKT